jgi:hypothetical protein
MVSKIAIAVTAVIAITVGSTLGASAGHGGGGMGHGGWGITGWGTAEWVDGMVDMVIPGLATDSTTASHSATTEVIDFVSGTGFSGTSSCSPGHRTATTTVWSGCGPAGVGACGRSATEAGDQSDA